jgi:hypothetical protein
MNQRRTFGFFDAFAIAGDIGPGLTPFSVFSGERSPADTKTTDHITGGIFA